MKVEHLNSILSKEEIKRYRAHCSIPEIGIEGQKSLKKAKILVIGMGGLGCPAAVHLVTSGIGNLGIADDDNVELTNLPRQIIYRTQDVGYKKLTLAKKYLTDLNPNVNIVLHEEKLNQENAFRLINNYDFIIDCTDNFSARYLINDACFFLKKILISGSVIQFEGRISVFRSEKDPCLRCLYPYPPSENTIPSCSEAGIISVVSGLIGTLQATEAIKLILRIGEPLIGRVLIYNALNLVFKELQLVKNLECPLCSEKPTIKELQMINFSCVSHNTDNLLCSPTELEQLLKSKKPPVLIDVREPFEYKQLKISGAQLIPFKQLSDHVSELFKYQKREIITYCHLGNRSMRAARFLRNAGLSNVRSLEGGIEAYEDLGYL